MKSQCVMADRTKHVGVTAVNNPLLSAAGSLFPFENFTSAAQLVPVSQRASSISLSEDVGEVDSFLGQDALPSIPLPGVLPPEIKKPSAEQLQPITFYNAQGKPTGGGGIDFFAPAEVTSYKSTESAFLTRHKQFASRRRPVLPPATTSSPVSSLPPAPPTSLASSRSQSTQLVSASSDTSKTTSLPLQPPPLLSTKISPLLQEPSISSKTLLLPPKSLSTPPSPITQLHVLTSAGQPLPEVSKSQPPTATPSPSHKSQTSPLISQSLSPPITKHSISDTESSHQTEGKQESVSSTKCNLVQSLVAELASTSIVTKKSSSENRLISKTYSETVPFESNTSFQFTEADSSHISASGPFDSLNKSLDLPKENQTSLSSLDEIATSVTEVQKSTADNQQKSSKLFESFPSVSEASHQSPHHQPSATVSLISPSTAEALLSSSLGKRFSFSEHKSESPSAESADNSSSSAPVVPKADPVNSCHSEGKVTAVTDFENVPNSDILSHDAGVVPSADEVNICPTKQLPEKPVSYAEQEVPLGPPDFPSTDKKIVLPPTTQDSHRKCGTDSFKDQIHLTTKVEHTPSYQPESLTHISPVAEVFPAPSDKSENLRSLPLASLPQSLESQSEKAVSSDFNLYQVSNQLSTGSLPTEDLSKNNKDHLDSLLLFEQDKTSNTAESINSYNPPSNFEALQITPQSNHQVESSFCETRLPTTSGLNSLNPPTPQHSHSTQPSPPSPDQSSHLGFQTAQPYPSQYFSPVEQTTQPLTTQSKQLSQEQFLSSRTETSPFPISQPSLSPLNQSAAQSTQSQPLYFTPTYPSQPYSAEQGQVPLVQPYHRAAESHQYPLNQAGQPLQQQNQFLTPSVQGQAPLFLTPTAPISQAFPGPLGQPPPSQFHTPATTIQSPLSHFATPTTSHPYPGQYFTPKTSQFLPPASCFPTSQASQEQSVQYLIPSTQPRQPPLVQFSTPRAQPTPPLSQKFTPSLDQAPPVLHTLPNGLYPTGTPQPIFLPPRPPSDHSLPPPPPLASSSPPLPPPPAQFPPSLHPSSRAPLPPPPKSSLTPNANVNQYSIHAKSHHSRRHYFSPTLQPERDYSQPPSLTPLPPIQPIPPPAPINQQNQPVTFLVPTQSSTPSPLPTVPTPANQQSQPVPLLVPKQSSSPSQLDTIPLAPAATPPAVYNSDPNRASAVSSQLPPFAPSSEIQPVSSIPLFPAPSPPNQPHYNPFSACATPSPLSLLQEKPQTESVPLPPPPSALHPPHSTPVPTVESSESVPLCNSDPAVSSPSANLQPSHLGPPPGTAFSDPTNYQGYTSDSTGVVDLLSSVPLNLSSHPPSAIPVGGPKNYRLGKQRPRYAQVPDLALSPSSISPVLSSNSSKDFYGAKSSAAEPYPIYPPGSQQLTSAEDYLVPTETSVSDTLEGIPSTYFNLATQPGSAAAAASGGSNTYHPVYCHWFVKKDLETKALWKPFSLIDSIALEGAYTSSETNENTIVATDGGRYDVSVLQRQRIALYWEEKKPTEVRRCSWFYKGPLDSRYTPYEEDFAAKLEEEYKLCVEANKWNKKIEYNGETVVLHGPIVMVHYSPSGQSDQLGVPADTSPVKPRVIKRGVDEFEIEEGEPAKVDHLLFLVHGIGSVCDLKFRDVVETVDDFRSLALQLTRSHFSMCVESNQANRVEVLPVSWHWKLHGEDTGIDRKLNSITLKSIPRLRNFTNDTLLDILFYTSPVYCQTIMDTVGNEMNHMYEIFLKRNPDFKGSVSVGGHSLGSLILFDLLYHQKVPKHPRSSPSIVMTGPGSQPPVTSPDKERSPEKGPSEQIASVDNESREEDDIVNDEAMATAFARSSTYNRRASRVNYMMGTAGTGQPYINYPQLNFKPDNFFALGSPIGMFVTVRGIEALGNNFRLPTCPGFFNIFHPFDPVAYRVESLIDPELAPTLNPVMIPHHKGRKRLHLELKETMARMGSDLKSKLVDSVKNTWNTMTQYSMFSRPEPPPTMESDVTKAIEAHLGPATVSAPVDIGTESGSEAGDPDVDVTLGCLNGGRRVDYVLQEAPLESFNEYLFALQSHVCYWESEDTMLMILTEIYRSINIKPDSVLTGADRDRSPMKILSDQFLASASPPKPQLFSTLRFPSSTSLSSEGSSSSLGVTRSQSVPKIMNDPNMATLSTSSPGYLESLGQPPHIGMDPTAPMSETKNLAPPPTAGFVKQSLQRK